MTQPSFKEELEKAFEFWRSQQTSDAGYPEREKCALWAAKFTLEKCHKLADKHPGFEPGEISKEIRALIKELDSQ